MKRSTTLLFAVLFFGMFFYACKNSNNEFAVLYDQEFEQVKALAKKERKPFCIVLSRPDCPPCQHYIEHLGELYKDFTSKIIFNIVDVL